MSAPMFFSLAAGDGAASAFGIPAAICVALGVPLFLAFRNPGRYVTVRDVFMTVVLGWLTVAGAGALPFILSGLMTPADAFLEAMAGFTTTGASTIEHPEAVAPSLLLWRSISQWVGGIGIVVLFVAVGPLVGFGAAQFFSAEVANPIPERLTPRLANTAKILAYIYTALTVAISVALLLAGMGPFDAANHALTTVSTGGFSTRSESIAAFDSVAVELVVVAGMVLSGANFAIYYQAAQGRIRRAITNRELLAYLGLIVTGTVLMTASLYTFDYRDSILFSLREALFQSVSLLTGTTYASADWRAWDPLSQSLLMIFMAIGGCAGSTSGGVKVIRVVLLFRSAAQELVRMVHPQAVTPLTLGGRMIPERLRMASLSFFFVYMATIAAGTLILALHGIPVAESFGAIFACVNITGTSLGPVGDPAFYAALPDTAKLTLPIFMLLGRLELFTVLVLLSPTFWRR